MKILFITSGVLPVPATSGGAVETLIDALAYQNEIALSGNIEFTFLSIYDKHSNNKAKVLAYKNSSYTFIKIPMAITFIDKVIYQMLNNFFKLYIAKKFRYAFQRLYFIIKCHNYLIINKEFDFIVVDNNISSLNAINYTDYEKKHCIYYAHNDVKKGFITKKKLSSCSKIITVSNYLNYNIKNNLKNKKALYPAIVTVKNGIDTDIFKPVSKECKIFNKIKYGFSKDDFIFIFVGRLVWEKGIEQLIKAFNNLVVQNTNIKLLVVGSNSFGLKIQTKFEEKIFKMCEKDKVKFTGFVENEKLPFYYSMADIAVLPSLWNEPAGLTMVEALACGLPLITTDNGGISEYVSKESAILIQKTTNNLVEKLEKEMKILIENPIKCNELSQRAIHCSDQFSHQSYYQNFINEILVVGSK